MRQEMDDSAEARRIRREARQEARRRQVFIQKMGLAAMALVLIILIAAAVRGCGRTDGPMEEPQSEGESLTAETGSIAESLLTEDESASGNDAVGTDWNESEREESGTEIETGTGTEAEAETETGIGTEAEAETETEEENESGVESGTEPVGTENEAEAQEAEPAASITGIANVSDSLNIRREASEESTVIGQIPAGERCEILESGDPWYHIRFGEMEGFVNGNYLLIE